MGLGKLDINFEASKVSFGGEGDRNGEILVKSWGGGKNPILSRDKLDNSCFWRELSNRYTDGVTGRIP